MATATHSSDAPSPEAIALGHPVLRISPGGQLQDGVVVQSEAGGMRLLVAVSLMRRRYASALATEASREEYGALLQYVESKGYFTAGQGDMQVALELFTLCSDGKYHRMDQFGHKLPTTVVPLRALAPIAELQTVSPAHAEVLVEPAGPAPEHGSGAGGDAEMAYMNNHIRLMRSILEWGADIGSLPVSGGLGVQPGDSSSDSDGGGEGTETQLGDVMVLVWPSGRILRVPRGTTAGTVVQCELQSHSGDGSGVDLEGDAIGLVNVNNRLVPGDQVLQDGDYVVLTKETVKV